MKITINSFLMNLNANEPNRKIVIDDTEKTMTDTYTEIRDEAEGILFRAKNSVYVFSPECHSIIESIKSLRDENSLVYNSAMDAIDWEKSDSLTSKLCAYNCLSQLWYLKNRCMSLKNELNSNYKRNVEKFEL